MSVSVNQPETKTTVQRIQAWLQSPAVVLVAILCVTMSLFFAGVRRIGRGDQGWVAGIATFAAVYLNVFLHEAGHLIAGMLSGLNILEFYCMPFKVVRANAGWQFRWGTWQDGIGHVRMLPGRELDMRHVASRFLIAVAGGPLVNLLLLICAAIVLFINRAEYFGNRSVEYFSDSPAQQFWTTTLVSALLLLMINILFGNTNSTVRTDGQSLRMLLRSGPEADRWLAMVLINTAIFNELPVSNWGAEWVMKATALEDNSPAEALANLMAAILAYDSGNIVKAIAHLERANQTAGNAPYGVRLTIMGELAYFRSRYQGDADSAEEALRRMGPLRLANRLDHTHLRLQVLHDIEAGRMSVARNRIRAGIRQSAKQKDLFRRVEKRLLEDLNSYLVIREAQSGLRPFQH